MKILSGKVLAVAVAAALFQPAYAHHSAAAFNTDTEVTVTGVVTEYSFRNPHVYMTLEVTQEDGSKIITARLENANTTGKFSTPKSVLVDTVIFLLSHYRTTCCTASRGTRSSLKDVHFLYR